VLRDGLEARKGCYGGIEKKDASQGSLPGEVDAYTRTWRIRIN